MTYDTPKFDEPVDVLTEAIPASDAGAVEFPAPSGDPILVAVDFSADSAAALRWAVDQADMLGAPVHIVHVVHDPAEAPGKYKPQKQDLLRPMADVAWEMMSDFIVRMRADRPRSQILEEAEMTLVAGLPAPAILNMARRLSARLVVVGTRGRTGLRRLILGSIAERVVQNSTVPVTVIKAEAP